MGNCPCTPLGGMCVYEKHHKDLMCCGVHILNYRFRELYKSLPIIGDWFENYHCPDFEIDIEKERSDDDNNK